MEKIHSNINKKIRIRCPECSNYLNANENEKNVISGQCPVCKVIIFKRKHSSRETLIKIIKQKNK